MPSSLLEDRTIFWLVENAPRLWAMLFRLGARQRTCDFLSRDLFFRRSPAFCDFFEWRPFSLESTSALCPWSLASSIPVLGLERAVLGRCVLGLGFFFVSLAVASSLVFQDSTSAFRVLKIKSVKWDPLLSTQFWRRSRKLFITRRVISCGMAVVSWRIASLSCSIDCGWLLYTFDLRYT